MKKSKKDPKRQGTKRGMEIDQDDRFDEEPEEQRRDREEETEEKE
jgi:hypothetical protein